jgi:hypothetical protein
LEEKINSGAGESSIHGSLGQAYAGLGRKAEAVREGLKIEARVGNTDEALSLIRQLLDMPAGYVMSPALLKLNPAWDPIRSDPRFQKLSQEKQP